MAIRDSFEVFRYTRIVDYVSPNAKSRQGGTNFCVALFGFCRQGGFNLILFPGFNRLSMIAKVKVWSHASLLPNKRGVLSVMA